MLDKRVGKICWQKLEMKRSFFSCKATARQKFLKIFLFFHYESTN